MERGFVYVFKTEAPLEKYSFLLPCPQGEAERNGAARRRPGTLDEVYQVAMKKA